MVCSVLKAPMSLHSRTNGLMPPIDILAQSPVMTMRSADVSCHQHHKAYLSTPKRASRYDSGNDGHACPWFVYVTGRRRSNLTRSVLYDAG